MGKVSKIQRFSVGDGPGIRTTVFLKGCPLHCKWCHNPETIGTMPVMMFYSSACTLCGKCKSVCKNGVHSFENGKHLINRAQCLNCGECVTVCPNNALEIDGKDMSADEVLDILIEDADFYKESGGGVTVSGGEPCYQREFTAEIAKKCRSSGIDVLIDTSGAYGFEAYKSILPFADKYYVDLKAATDEDYKKHTGGRLEKVLDSIKGLILAGKDVTVRIPIIPGLSFDRKYAAKMAELLKNTGAKKVDLLPFHNLCRSKYASLGANYEYDNTDSLTKAALEPLLEAFDGFEVKITN